MCRCAILIIPLLAFSAIQQAFAADPACLSEAAVQYELTAADRTIGTLRDTDARVANLEENIARDRAKVAEAEASGADTEASLSAKINLSFSEALLASTREERRVAQRIFDRRMQTIIDACGEAGRDMIRARYGL